MVTHEAQRYSMVSEGVLWLIIILKQRWGLMMQMRHVMREILYTTICDSMQMRLAMEISPKASAELTQKPQLFM